MAARKKQDRDAAETGPKRLAGQVTDDDLGVGRIFPPQRKLRDAAVAVASTVARVAFETGLNQIPARGFASRRDAGNVSTGLLVRLGQRRENQLRFLTSSSSSW